MNEILSEMNGKAKAFVWGIITMILLALAVLVIAFSAIIAKDSLRAAGAVCVTIFIAWFIFTASMLFASDGWKITLLKVAAISIPAGFCRYWAPKAPAVIAIILGVAMMIAMIYIAIWWSADGSDIKEFLVFLVIDSMLAWISLSGVARVYSLTEVKWITGLIMAAPQIFCVMSLGYFLFDMIGFRSDVKSGDFDPYDYLDD